MGSPRKIRRSRSSRTRTPRAGKSGGHSGQQSRSARIFQQGGLDINTNLGEGFGHYRIDGESDILPYVTSVNIACGAHAGDPVLMEAALEEARYYGLSVGAHVGYPDLAGFGRREMHMSQNELRACILYQLGSLAGLAKTLGFEITQVRPHGYLYRQMAHDVRTAVTVAKALAEFDSWLVLIGPCGSNLLTAGSKAGIRVAGEALVDRSYDANGNLLPHSHSKAIIKNPKDILKQAALLVRTGSVKASDGSTVKLDFQTIHLHAQIPEAKYVAERIRMMVPDAGSLSSEPYSVDESEQSILAYGD